MPGRIEMHQRDEAGFGDGKVFPGFPARHPFMKFTGC
jgi:hypothetical protein